MKALLIAASAILITPWVFASENCVEVKKELSAMRAAQSRIMVSLVANHEAFASSLEEYSSIVGAPQRSQSLKAVSQNMNQSAKAFRQRGLQGKQMALRLEKATDDLLTRAEACIK